MAKAADKVIKEDTAEPTPAAETIRAKSVMMSGILAAMNSMDNDQLMQWYQDSMELAAPVAGDDKINKASIVAKPSAAVGSAVREDTLQIFSGEGLNEEAMDRVNTLIEHAVDVRVAIESQRLEEEFQTKLLDESVRIQEELVEKVDGYVTYAAEQWIEKNEAAVESAIKLERAERLLSGLAELFNECNVEVPEGKDDVVESLETRVEELQSKLNESIEEVLELRRGETARRAMDVLATVSEGLTPIETEKFRKLVEDVEVDVEPEDLERKLRIIRDVHFKTPAPTKTGITEALELGDDDPKTTADTLNESIDDPRIARYAQAISRASNRYGSARKVAR